MDGQGYGHVVGDVEVYISVRLTDWDQGKVKITAQFETNCPKMCGILKNVWESLVNVCGQP